MPNIWTLDDDKERDDQINTEFNNHHTVVTGTSQPDDDDDELDRPSFLRRLKGFAKRDSDDKSKEEHKK
jgi:hypothetical protein